MRVIGGEVHAEMLQVVEAVEQEPRAEARVLADESPVSGSGARPSRGRRARPTPRRCPASGPSPTAIRLRFVSR